MKPSKPLLLVASLTLCGCAGQTWRASAGPMFVQPRGDVSLQNAGGTLVLGDNQNNFDNNLGLGETETVPHLRLETDIKKHRIRLSGFYVDAEGNGTLAGDFGGIVAGSVVSTKLDFYSVNANYAYQLLRGKNYRIAAGGMLGFYGLDVQARSTPGREEVETSVLLPLPFVEAEVFTGPLTIGANLGIMAGDFGDGNGRYWDFDGYLKLKADERFDVTAGYRYVLLDAFGTASSRDFRADVDMQGIYLTAGVRF